jgi:hypothetical protein
MMFINVIIFFQLHWNLGRPDSLSASDSKENNCNVVAGDILAE